MIYIGIDPGKFGALAYIEVNGDQITGTAMPYSEDGYRFAIRNLAEELALRKRLYLANREYLLLLAGYVHRVVGSSYRLALLGLVPLAEHLAHPLSCLSAHLSGNDVGDRAEDDFGILVAVVPDKLAEVLHADHCGYLIGTCGGDKLIQPLQEDGRKLVEHHTATHLPRLVDLREDSGGIEGQESSVDGFSVRTVAQAEYLGTARVVDV